jgi:signal transduction histidine kinase
MEPNTEDALKRVPFFSTLSEAQLADVASAGSTRALDAESMVFREGEPGTELFVIRTGRVRVFKQDADGTEVDIAWPVAGDVFGEMALLDGGLRSASVITQAPCTFFTLDRSAFLGTLRRSPELLAQVTTALTSRIRESSNAILRQELSARALRTETELQRHRAVSQMVAGVAHEVNTPLGIARTAVGVIRNSLAPLAESGAASPEQRAEAIDDTLSALDLLERNVLRAYQLVQDFKRVAAGQSVDIREPLQLAEVVSEVLRMFSIQARHSKLDVRLANSLGADADQWTGYRGYLTQILLNLLTNVERYAYAGGGGGRVDVSIDSGVLGKAPAFVVTVRDYGAGIPAADVEKVFEPFFTTGRGKGGTGLGLAIVHTLATASLKGTVTVQSKPGEGTAFVLTFPQTIPE